MMVSSPVAYTAPPAPVLDERALSEQPACCAGKKIIAMGVWFQLIVWMKLIPQIYCIIFLNARTVRRPFSPVKWKMFSCKIYLKLCKTTDSVVPGTGKTKTLVR